MGYDFQVSFAKLVYGFIIYREGLASPYIFRCFLMDGLETELHPYGFYLITFV